MIMHGDLSEILNFVQGHSLFIYYRFRPVMCVTLAGPPLLRFSVGVEGVGGKYIRRYIASVSLPKDRLVVEDLCVQTCNTFQRCEPLLRANAQSSNSPQYRDEMSFWRVGGLCGAMVGDSYTREMGEKLFVIVLSLHLFIIVLISKRKVCLSPKKFLLLYPWGAGGGLGPFLGFSPCPPPPETKANRP